MPKQIFLILIFIICIPMLNSCNKDAVNEDDIIPDVSFYGEVKQINSKNKYTTTNPFYVTIDSDGDTIGNHGVVIYKVDDETFYVYDRMCPYEYLNEGTSSLVEVYDDDEDDEEDDDVYKTYTYLKCPECGSLYYSYSGSLKSGPSNYSLKQYSCSVSGTSLVIWNN